MVSGMESCAFFGRTRRALMHALAVNPEALPVIFSTRPVREVLEGLQRHRSPVGAMLSPLHPLRAGTADNAGLPDAEPGPEGKFGCGASDAATHLRNIFYRRLRVSELEPMFRLCSDVVGCARARPAGWASMTRASLRCPGRIRLAGLSKSEAARSKRAMVSRTAALTRVPCQHLAPSDTMGKEELACRVGSRGHQNGSSLTTNTSSPPFMKRRMPICFGCHRTDAFTKTRASRNTLCNTGMIRLLSSRISRRLTSNSQSKGQSLSLQVAFLSKSARRGHILSKRRADKQSSAATASTLEFSAYCPVSPTAPLKAWSAKLGRYASEFGCGYHHAIWQMLLQLTFGNYLAGPE